ncbi:MAG TPA: HypC/HybG/HupF family hydrogenase formation chaperone [Blastocatellia bacterium]|jgi:hydrogenase expression/formation protein HypC|nr:HypC/HybG/HupF family hydrogenase formation chaperone [Blastocatellia bacterium]HST20788.1 HypC/HybG/HupF family hydrogenase formation chaperone [Blastocatellia bacterium]
MCLAIPGKIVEIVDPENQIAKVNVGGVKRNVNVGMLDNVIVGDYVLVHVGFAMSKVDEKEAEETLRLLQELGSYEEEFDQFKSSID